MKRTLAFILTAAVLLALPGCSRELTDKDKIIALFRNNENVFVSAVETGDYSEVKKIKGVNDVSVRGDNEETEFYCGGMGLVPSSAYFGILYIRGAEGKDYPLVFGDGAEWSADGDGYRFKQADGDNDFYYQALGGGFYYYEERY